MNDCDYFNSYWHMQPQGENGVLFSAEYAQLLKLRGRDNEITQFQAGLACFTAERKTQEHPLSHDNATAIVCLSKQFGLHYHKRLTMRDWKRRLHPRDICFYLYAKYPILKPLLIVTIISMIVAVYHKKQSNGVLDTDGKLLAWLRFTTFDWSLTNRLCSYILKKRHNLDWADIFYIYFQNYSKDHPNIRHSKRIYK